ncbi:cystinosin-like [Oratosquilla oratoria]|uniref:cystinosin-like n=1 Tax=Oratosquilla oratoria TaxID=337810 RepID=UPI003F775C2C
MPASSTRMLAAVGCLIFAVVLTQAHPRPPLKTAALLEEEGEEEVFRSKPEVYFEPSDVTLVAGQDTTVTFYISGVLEKCVNISFEYDRQEMNFEPFEPIHVCPKDKPGSPESNNNDDQEEEEEENETRDWILSNSGSFSNKFSSSGSNLPLMRRYEKEVYVTPLKIVKTFVWEPATLLRNGDIACNETIPIITTHQGKNVVKPVAEDGSIQMTHMSYLHVSVMLKESINILADVFGWIYTICWDITSIPQIIYNFRRKSVVGYNYDMVTFNVIGFTFYAIFNVGLYAIPYFQNQFYERHPTGVNHVRLNDVVFPIFAVLCQLTLILQCIFYKRDKSRRVVSILCICISIGLVTAVVISMILVAVDVFWWLDVLYTMSYCKLCVTAIKYPPQLLYNFQRKSTEGMSIEAFYLDLTGGVMSLLQMFTLASNYDDWVSILSDPTKLGLGSIAICYDICLILQHHVFFRHANKKKNPKELEDENNRL